MRIVHDFGANANILHQYCPGASLHQLWCSH